MQIEVSLRDGRTSFRFKNRALLVEALGRKPEGQERRRIVAEIKRNRDDPEWSKCSIRSLSANSISFALEVSPDEAHVQGGVEG